jgi:hypothetical protein
MDHRDRDREPDSPDPTHDEWSAWLPQLDPPTSAAAGPLPQASAPPPGPDPMPPPVPPSPRLLPYAAAPAPPWSGPHSAYSKPPTSYLGWAIICTIVCFMPFGVVAIIKASQVSSRWAQGDLDGACRASRAAKVWCLLALGVWLASLLLFGSIGLMGGGHFSMHL